MSKDSDIAVAGKTMTYVRKRRRELYGVPCPRCPSNRCPTILLPKQRCKVDLYVDPRPRITEEQEDAIWAEQGYTRKSSS